MSFEDGVFKLGEYYDDETIELEVPFNPVPDNLAESLVFTSNKDNVHITGLDNFPVNARVRKLLADSLQRMQSTFDNEILPTNARREIISQWPNITSFYTTKLIRIAIESTDDGGEVTYAQVAYNPHWMFKANEAPVYAEDEQQHDDLEKQGFGHSMKIPYTVNSVKSYNHAVDMELIRLPKIKDDETFANNTSCTYGIY